jgi:Zn-finger nucleic acid-binding protein
MDTPRPATNDAPVTTCPKCRAAMEPVTYQDITVDRCTACHGLWFDILEQRRLRERAGSEVIDDGAPAAAPSAPSAAPATRLACPRCTAPMTRLRDVDNRSIEYEYCAVCNGAFFDAGEFRQYKDASFLGTLRGLFRKGG